jgi:hypothetical protein
MPYYGIVIWIKRRKKPYEDISVIADPNINSVYNFYHSKADREYQKELIDVLCTILKSLIALKIIRNRLRVNCKKSTFSLRRCFTI